MLTGNDLVDLRAPEVRGKSRDGRFIARVFTPGEAALIAASPLPDRALWMLWAGKEAAFKIARKLRPSTYFAHAAYEVVPAIGESAPGTTSTEWLRGHVHLRGVPELEGASFPVEWEVAEGFVHCVATDAERDGRRVWTMVESLEELERRLPAYDLSERELASARTAESRAVRRLARALAMEAGLGGVEIVRERDGATFGPPRIYRLGEARPLEGWDVTLSHDGGLVAAAVSGKALGRSPRPAGLGARH